MLNLDRLQRANSGLASSANRPCPQNCNSDDTAPLEPLTSLKAITILLDQHNDEIFAYLKFARSLRQNILYSPGHGSLSLDQYRAVWALRNCSDVDIRTWLKEARKPCETVAYPFKLQGLTPTSERLRTAQVLSGRDPSSTYLRIPLFIRAGARRSLCSSH